MSDINAPFATQDGFATTTATIASIVFDNGSIQNTAFTGTVAASEVTGLAAVATSGAYSDLSGTPTLPDQALDTTSTVSFAGLTVAGQTYPTADGTSGQVLSTNGSGSLSWVDQTGGGGGGVTSITAGTGTYVSTSTGAVTVWTDGGGGGGGVGNGIVVNSTTATGISGTTPVLVSSYNTTQFDGSEHYIKIRDGIYLYSSQFDVVTDGTNTWAVEYSINANTSTLGTLSATVSSGDLNVTFTPTAAASLSLVSVNTIMPLLEPLLPVPTGGPPVTDYNAWYDITSVNLGTGIWEDKSINGNNATIAGAPTIVAGTGFGASQTFDVISGGTSDNITFPTYILNASGYTLFHVTRRPGGSGRIMTAPSSDNWFSGHWQTTAGTCFHNGWLTGTSDYYGNSWLINTDQQYFYRPNGNVSLQGSGGGGLIPNVIGISISTTEPASQWQVAEVVIYPRELNSTEIDAMEAYFAARYGITLGV